MLLAGQIHCMALTPNDWPFPVTSCSLQVCRSRWLPSASQLLSIEDTPQIEPSSASLE
jgi:hypothetical protein